VSRAHAEDGAVLVELAFSLPLFLLFVVLLVDFGNALYVRVAVQDAAAEGAMVAVYEPDRPGVVRDRVVQATNVSITGSEVSITCPSATSVRVTVTHEHPWLTGSIGPSTTMVASVDGDVLSSTRSCVPG